MKTETKTYFVKIYGTETIDTPYYVASVQVT